MKRRRRRRSACHKGFTGVGGRVVDFELAAAQDAVALHPSAARLPLFEKAVEVRNLLTVKEGALGV